MPIRIEVKELSSLQGELPVKKSVDNAFNGEVSVRISPRAR